MAIKKKANHKNKNKAKKFRRKFLIAKHKLNNKKRAKKNKAKKIIKHAKKIKPVKRKIIRVKKTEQKQKIEIETFSPKAMFRAKIKVVGIGGGGGSIVSEIGRALDKASFMIADTDIRALKKKSGIKYFWFGQDITHGLGTGVNPELAKTAAENEKEKIAEFFKGQDIVIFIASLGGGLGSGAAEVFAEVAKELNVISFGIFTLPFKFEGKKKEKIAKSALRKIRESLSVSIAIPNEKIFKIIDNNTPIVQAFSIVNKNLADSLESLIDLIYSPGLINIDFADVSAILRGRGNLAFLNSAESSGKNRAEELIKKITFNPLYQNNNFIAEKILFNIAGDSSLSMFEVEKISRYIGEINPKAKIIFGVSKNLKLKKKIKATLLMAGPSKLKEKEEAPLKEPVAEEKPKKAVKKEKEAPFVIPLIDAEILNQEKLDMVLESNPVKKTIRRNALEIKKAEAIEEDKKFLQEKEWEIPAFLRKRPTA